MNQLMHGKFSARDTFHEKENEKEIQQGKEGEQKRERERAVRVEKIKMRWFSTKSEYKYNTDVVKLQYNTA